MTREKIVQLLFMIFKQSTMGPGRKHCIIQIQYTHYFNNVQMFHDIQCAWVKSNLPLTD